MTMEDMFRLARHLYFNKKFLLGISANRFRDAAYEVPTFRDLVSENGLADDTAFIGGKTSASSERYGASLSVFMLDINGFPRQVVVALASSSALFSDVERMISWIREVYGTR